MARIETKPKSPTQGSGQQSANDWGTTYDIGNLAFGDRESGHRLKPEKPPAVESDRRGNGEIQRVQRIDTHRSRSR